MLLGDYQTGKSTLFSYLCEGREMPGIGNCSPWRRTCAALSDSAKEEYVQIRLPRQKKKSFPLHALPILDVTSTECEQNYFLHTPILEELGCIVRDTPGLNSADESSEAAEYRERSIEEASYIIYVCHACSLAVRQEVFYQECLRRKKVVLALNSRGSKRDSLGDLVDTIRAQVESIGAKKPPIVVVHARLALYAQQLQTQRYRLYASPFSSVVDATKLREKARELEEVLESDRRNFIGDKPMPSWAEVERESGVPELFEQLQVL